MSLSKLPVILNFDDSVGALPKAKTWNLQTWQERIRFACRWPAFQALERKLEQLLPAPSLCGPIFLGSGDYHHISYLLIKRLGRVLPENIPSQPLDIIIFDNHPDNMRYPFGIHCGSWVSHLAKLPFIGHIDVVGISSNDIGIAHAVENRLLPLIKGKLTYWSVGVDIGWAQRLGLGKAFRNFKKMADLTEAFLAKQAGLSAPVYCSLDKDVLARSVVRTNWDQGVMDKQTLFTIIEVLKPRIIASDVVGEVSNYHYKSPFKRFMSHLDGQEAVSRQELAVWQKKANAFNHMLLPLLS